MDILNAVCTGLTTLLSVFMIYQVVYAAIGLFCKAKKFKDAEREHKFGIVIAARNESAVVGNLLDSIAVQNYDMSKITVFVVADNCNDNTAEVCRAKGAVVYERHEPEKARKGYALEFLFNCIERDFGIESFEGYLFFDADNLLHPNFLHEINKAFDTGTDAAVGYRNTKNFSTNFISAAYGIHFCRSSFMMHRPRTLLGLPTHIAGTGYVMRSSLLKNGWHYTSLTEDTQFTLSGVADGVHIEFCESAEFFDEQPYEFKVMVRQRIRWAKGRLFCFFKCGAKLLKGIFVRPETSKGKRFACYDMFFYAFPKALFSSFVSGFYSLVSVIVAGVAATYTDLPSAALGLANAFFTSYAGFVLIGALTVIRERSHIKCSGAKLVFYVLMFPIFDLTGLPISIASLFMRVKWKPIKHDKDIKIDELVNANESNEKSGVSN